jgi:hypothetical protein
VGRTEKMKSITLNRKQITQLVQIVEHFKEVEHFTIESDSTSGIGPNIRVKFDLFNKNTTTVDITDVESW